MHCEWGREREGEAGSREGGRRRKEGELEKRHINSSDCIERKRERALGVRAEEIYGFGRSASALR